MTDTTDFRAAAAAMMNPNQGDGSAEQTDSKDQRPKEEFWMNVGLCMGYQTLIIQMRSLRYSAHWQRVFHLDR